jgi:hypothetical protein
MMKPDKYDYGLQKKITKKRKYGDYFAEQKKVPAPEEEQEISKEFKRFRLNPTSEKVS